MTPLVALLLGALAMADAPSSPRTASERSSVSTVAATIERVEALIQDGNPRDARELALQTLRADAVDGARPTDEQIAELLTWAVQADQRLAGSGVDAIVAEALTLDLGPRAIGRLGTTLLEQPSLGVVREGRFVRLGRSYDLRPGEERLSVDEQDRQRAILLLAPAAVALLEAGEPADEAAKAERAAGLRALLTPLETALRSGREGMQLFWRLQQLTPLVEPNYTQPVPTAATALGAPVAADGSPLVFEKPASWDAAQSDGQRLEWVRSHLRPLLSDEDRFDFDLTHARRLRQLYGVQTIPRYGHVARALFEAEGIDTSDDARKPAAIPLSRGEAILSLSELGDDETVAQLADGIARFKLPDSLNFVAQLKRLHVEQVERDRAQRARRGKKAANAAPEVRAAEELADVYADRFQRPRAAAVLREALEPLSKVALSRKASRRARVSLGHLVLPQAELSAEGTHPAGQPLTLTLRHRNATRIDFTAYRLDNEMLLAEVRGRLTEDSYIDPASIPRELWEKRTKSADAAAQWETLTTEVARWGRDLTPKPGYGDARETIVTPLTEGGGYVIVARVSGPNPIGNLADVTEETKIVDGKTTTTIALTQWLTDLAMVQHETHTGLQTYVCEAGSGLPVAGAEVQVLVARFDSGAEKNQLIPLSARTNDDGLATVSYRQLEAVDSSTYFDTLTIVRGPGGDGRFGWMPNDFIGIPESLRDEDDRPVPPPTEIVPLSQTAAFGITARPVYRPGETMQTHVWWVRASHVDPAPLAGPVTLELVDPAGETLAEHEGQLDRFGGIAADFAIPATARLGKYRINASRLPPDRQPGTGWKETVSAVTVRVEEYRRPEFEVTIETPEQPTTLGQPFEVTIAADYYAGGGVAGGQVQLTVTREAETDRWFPVQRFDWLYGRGYGCFGGGWSRLWRPWETSPSEIVLQQVVSLDEQGRAVVSISTETAVTLREDRHRYRIEADVTDLSRRVVRGNGSVLVARQPVEVTAWARAGFGRDGQPAEFDIAVQTPDGRAVAGEATVTLVQLDREAGTLAERPVDVKTLAFDGTQTDAVVTLTPPAAGVYEVRIDFVAAANDDAANDDAAGDDAAGDDAADDDAADDDAIATTTLDWLAYGDQLRDGTLRTERFAALPDRRTYRPGETAHILLTGPRDELAVLQWQPFESVWDVGYPKTPTVQRLPTGVAIVEVPITAADQPNRFVEFLTVYDGQMQVETVELRVPPAEQMLQATLSLDREEYKPGELATVAIEVTDAAGRPVETALVVSAYDRSLDALVGGSNIGDIRESVWDFRRYESSDHETNLVPRGGWLPPFHPFPDVGRFDDVPVPQKEAAGGGGFFGGGGLGGAYALGAALMTDGAKPKAVGRAMEADAFGGAPPESAADLAVVDVREAFADTALWSTALVTDSDGRANASLTWPDNLSDWRVQAWGVSVKVQVAHAESSARTSRDLLVRLQTPRFLTETDEVVLSATVQNKTEAAMTADVDLQVEGPLSLAAASVARTIAVAAGEQARVQWRAKAEGQGEAAVTVRAAARTTDGSPGDSDGMTLRVPVKRHGALHVETWSGHVAAGETNEAARRIAFEIPAERDAAQTRLELRLSPSLAGSIVDALPYLAEYPYGCSEQTLNRFLPTVIARDTLNRLDLDLADLSQSRLNPEARDRLAAGEPPRPNVPAWKRRAAADDRTPVFDAARVDDMIAVGLARLASLQRPDGGWGWFPAGSGNATSNPHLTALVTRGLLRAHRSNLPIPRELIDKPLAWLDAYQQQQLERLAAHETFVAARKRDPEETSGEPRKPKADALDAFVFLVLTDAEDEWTIDGDAIDNDALQTMSDYLYRDRTSLSLLSLAQFGIALHMSEPEGPRLAMVVQNLDQHLVVDEELGTAFLELPAAVPYWRWYGDPVETQATALQLYTRVRPRDGRTAGLAASLVRDRRYASRWSSTRDTALAVEALADSLLASGELSGEHAIAVRLDGETVKEVTVDRRSLLDFDGTLVLEGEALAAGEHTLEVAVQGGGRVYYGLTLANFTRVPFIEAAGVQARVRRRLWHLVPTPQDAAVPTQSGQVQAIAAAAYERHLLQPGATLPSGELVEVELLLEMKTDAEYLLLEDFKVAGCEPVESTSGYRDGAYVEFRDDRTALFLERAAVGTQSLRYQLRTEQPGQFSGLPAVVQALYAPELRGNSDEAKLTVE